MLPMVCKVFTSKAILAFLLRERYPQVSRWALFPCCLRSPNTQPLNFLGSYSLVGIGQFNLLFLWLIGVVRDSYSWWDGLRGEP